jgi:6-pyruvoyltetrahydropterin/6-carboxytetrahydropterin synthase
MMVRMTTKFFFDAAHRMYNYEGKCRFLHGHHYQVEVTLAAEALDKDGFVLDYRCVKDALSGWVNEHWDHNTILSDRDKELGQVISASTGQNVFYIAGNPTVEAMVKHLMQNVCPQIFINLPARCERLSITEYEHCSAEMSHEDKTCSHAVVLMPSVGRQQRFL